MTEPTPPTIRREMIHGDIYIHGEDLVKLFTWIREQDQYPAGEMTGLKWAIVTISGMTECTDDDLIDLPGAIDKTVQALQGIERDLSASP